LAGTGIKDDKGNALTKDQVVDKIKNNKFVIGYLSLLREWVNAHPQVLNPGYIKNPKDEFGADASKGYPENEKKFKIYRWYPGESKDSTETSLNGLWRELLRIKSATQADSNKYKTASFLNNIGAYSAMDINVPLARALYMGDFGVGQIGGHGSLGEIERLLSGKNNASSTLFADLYDKIVKILYSNGIKLSDKSRDKIDGKLESFKRCEQALNKDILAEIDRVKILRQTQGRIDLDGYPDSMRDEIKNRYSGKVISSMNEISRRGGELFGVFQAMIIGCMKNKFQL